MSHTDSQGNGIQGSLRGPRWVLGDTQIVRQNIRCTQRDQRQRGGFSDEPLRYIQDRAVAAARKNGVTACADGVSCLTTNFDRRQRGGNGSFDAGATKNFLGALHGFQMAVVRARMRIVKKQDFAHVYL